jgi:hypothetical protein
VQQLLNDSADSICSVLPDQSEHFLSNPHAEDEQDDAEGAVDNRKRRW